MYRQIIRSALGALALTGWALMTPADVPAQEGEATPPETLEEIDVPDGWEAPSEYVAEMRSMYGNEDFEGILRMARRVLHNNPDDRDAQYWRIVALGHLKEQVLSSGREETMTPKQKAVLRMNRLLGELPTVVAEQRGEDLVLLGWTRNEEERVLLDELLQGTEFIDLTTADIADRNRMVEIDVIIVVVGDTATQSTGFNFLDLIQIQGQVFSLKNDSDTRGITGFNSFGNVVTDSSNGAFVSARVDYDVNIANTDDENVQILARPHLTTLNGERAEFHSGGRIVFRVSGIDNGDIRPYPFGITLNVTPTILRTPGVNGEEQILLDVEAERVSVLGRLLATTFNDDVIFDSTEVRNKSVLQLNETLILSGLYTRESRDRFQGVPILRGIPFIRMFFSEKGIVDETQTTVLFLTPRRPGKLNLQIQEDTRSFIERRRRYIGALSGSEEDIARFKEEYPDWFKPQPNRYASHLYLINNSNVYKQIRGEDLRTGDIERNLLSVETAHEAQRKRRDQLTPIRQLIHDLFPL